MSGFEGKDKLGSISKQGDCLRRCARCDPLCEAQPPVRRSPMRPPSPPATRVRVPGAQFTRIKISSIVQVGHCRRRQSQEHHQDRPDGRLLPPKVPANRVRKLPTA